MKKWIYVGHVRAHTHDVRALTVAVPIAHEGPLLTCACRSLKLMLKSWFCFNFGLKDIPLFWVCYTYCLTLLFIRAHSRTDGEEASF